MYTISYVDRTNISLALDPRLSSMMGDLFMDDRMKGQAAGMFFLGYVMLQMAGGYWASRWSPKKLVSILLVCWGICAAGCGLVKTFHQFEVTRFFLGVAESGVFPATTVLLANWFPKTERARANGYWNLCQPLAIVVSAHLNTGLLSSLGWQKMLMIEGALPFVWLPVWWYFISDHPAQAGWITESERLHIERALEREKEKLEPSRGKSIWSEKFRKQLMVMVTMNFFHNFAAYGCMTFFTTMLAGHDFTPAEYGTLFAIPYALTAVIMVLNSWHSDKTGERRGHIAAVYAMSGSCLIASVLVRDHFWISYGLMCFAIPGPFAALAPFWAIPGETMPRKAMGPVIGFVNTIGSGIGGFTGPFFTGWLKGISGSVSLPFGVLGAGLIVAACLSFLLPKAVEDDGMENATA
jgi:MFS family permease